MGSYQKNNRVNRTINQRYPDEVSMKNSPPLRQSTQPLSHSKASVSMRR